MMDQSEYNVPKPYRYESNSILKSVKDAVPEARADPAAAAAARHARREPGV